MKHLAPLMVFLVATGAYGQDKLPDVVLTKPDGYQETYTTPDRTPAGLFKLIESVVETKAQDGDDVRFRGEAKNTKADQLRLHNGTFGGFGREQSKLVTVNRIDKPVSTPAIIPADDTTIADCTLTNDCYDKNEDGGLLGYDRSPADLKQVRKLTLRNVAMDGRTNGDWLNYAWGDNRWGPEWLIEDCEFRFPRQGISLCASAAKNQSLTVRRTKFIGDANWSHSYGETSSSDQDTGVLAPIVIRSGKALIEGCEFWLTGWKSPDGKPYSANGRFAINRVVGIVTDQYSSKVGAGTEPQVTIKNCIVHQLDGGEAQVVKYVDMRYGKATWDNSGLIAEAEAAKARAIERNKAEFDVFIKASRARIDAAEAEIKAAQVPVETK